MTVFASYLIAINIMTIAVAIMFWRLWVKAGDALYRERVQRVIAERIALREEARRLDR